MVRILVALGLVAAAASAQVSSPRRAYTAPELLDAPEEWIARSLAWAGQMLDQFPPGLPENPVRRAALIRLDDILHIESAPKKPLVHQFYRERMEKVLGEIEQTKITSGARVWKLYNDTFVVRTPSVTFAFDVVPGPPGVDGFRVSPEWIQRLAAQTDALFISHLHADHANQEVAKAFLDQGKPVLAVERLWTDQPEFSRRMVYPERSATKIHEITVKGGKLRYVAYPGHQGPPVNNNNFLVISPEGFTALHTGDQSSFEADYEWMAQIGNQHNVDVLFPNCWTDGLQRMIRGVNPRYVITGHENEMAHTVDHREDYTQTYNHMFGSPYPFLLMGWGEGYSIAPSVRQPATF